VAWDRERRCRDCVADVVVPGVDINAGPVRVAQATPWLIDQGDLLATA